VGRTFAATLVFGFVVFLLGFPLHQPAVIAIGAVVMTASAAICVILGRREIAERKADLERPATDRRVEQRLLLWNHRFTTSWDAMEQTSESPSDPADG
jgi:hypothetical protein